MKEIMIHGFNYHLGLLFLFLLLLLLLQPLT